MKYTSSIELTANQYKQLSTLMELDLGDKSDATKEKIDELEAMEPTAPQTMTWNFDNSNAVIIEVMQRNNKFVGDVYMFDTTGEQNAVEYLGELSNLTEMEVTYKKDTYICEINVTDEAVTDEAEA